jgi:hypothetical protein
LDQLNHGCISFVDGIVIALEPVWMLLRKFLYLGLQRGPDDLFDWLNHIQTFKEIKY